MTVSSEEDRKCPPTRHPAVRETPPTTCNGATAAATKAAPPTVTQPRATPVRVSAFASDSPSNPAPEVAGKEDEETKEATGVKQKNTKC